MNSFKGKYKNIEKGKWFYTIRAILPRDFSNIIIDKLRPLRPYCDWIATMSNDYSRDLPHVTLRYLGYSDELNYKKVIKDKGLFEQVLSEIMILGNMKIELGRMFLWTSKTGSKIDIARINWEILDPRPFIQLHEALLKVPNYYLFEELEQDNYEPHISLGSVNMTTPSNYKYIRNYLDSQKFGRYEFQIKRVKLNLISSGHEEVIPIMM